MTVQEREAEGQGGRHARMRVREKRMEGRMGGMWGGKRSKHVREGGSSRKEESKKKEKRKRLSREEWERRTCRQGVERELN